MKEWYNTDIEENGDWDPELSNSILAVSPEFAAYEALRDLCQDRPICLGISWKVRARAQNSSGPWQEFHLRARRQIVVEQIPTPRPPVPPTFPTQQS